MRIITSVLLALSLLPGMVAAQDYPTRNITILVGVDPGGATDIEGRMYAQKLTERLGKSVVLDYKPGAGTTIAANFLSRAAPDGHTLMAISPSFSVAPIIYPDLPYDTMKSFAFISLMSKKPGIFNVPPNSRFLTFKDYIDFAKANPGKLNVGTSGAGSAGHLYLATLHQLINADVTFIHYKGGTGANIAVMAGQIDASMAGPSDMLGNVKAGKARLLAVSSLERSGLMPQTPTVAEHGIAIYDYFQWFGVMAPAKTPPAIVNKLNAEFARVARLPDIVEKLAASMTVMVGGSPEQLRDHVQTETARMRKAMKDNGISPK